MFPYFLIHVAYMLKHCGCGEIDVEILTYLYIFALPTQFENAALGVPSVYMFTCTLCICACMFVCINVCMRVWMYVPLAGV
jgi:hypothetical protein